VFFLLHYNYWGKLFMKNSPILDKVCSYVEVKSSSPSFHFFIGQPSMDCLPSPSPRSPSLSTLPSPSTSLPCPFRSSLYSFFSQNLPYSLKPSPFPLNLPLSLSIFPFPSQPFPFPLNLSLFLSTFLFPLSTVPFPLNLPLSL
jgi:hypothetical protein